MKSKGLLDKLAEIEHEQWVQWANAVKGEVSLERAKRWEGYMVPYSELSEKAKDMDRLWATKVIACLITDLVGESTKRSEG